MGKRKRSQTSAIVLHSSPSDSMPCSSGRELTPGENSSDPKDSSIFKPNPSLKEIMEGRGKQPNSQLSLGQHHQQNLSRSMYLKRSRNHYGNQYSRRNSSNNHKPSTSFGRGSSFHDERLCLKQGGKHNSDLGHHSDLTEFREKAFMQPERIRSSALVIHAVSPVEMRMTCVLCQQPLRQKALNIGSTSLAPEEDVSVVAVLVCGHIFHTDCLEHKSCLEDKRDPPCPICSGIAPNAEA